MFILIFHIEKRATTTHSLIAVYPTLEEAAECNSCPKAPLKASDFKKRATTRGFDNFGGIAPKAVWVGPAVEGEPGTTTHYYAIEH